MIPKTSDENEPWSMGTDSRVFFTELGYDGTLPTEDNKFNYKECKSCNETYKGSLTIRLKLGSEYIMIDSKKENYQTEPIAPSPKR